MSSSSTDGLASSTPSMLEVGRVTRPHGVRGEVNVLLTSNRTERVAPGAVLTTPSGAGLEVVSSRPHKNGFIVLLSSSRSPRGLKLPASARFGPKVLQRFDLRGEPVGEPFDLGLPLKQAGSTIARNWEGLGWFEPGKKLMLVFDGFQHPPEVVFEEVTKG